MYATIKVKKRIRFIFDDCSVSQASAFTCTNSRKQLHVFIIECVKKNDAFVDNSVIIALMTREPFLVN